MTTQHSADSSLACPSTTYCAAYLLQTKTALTVPCDTGRINAVIAEQRGSLTTEESIRIPLKALGDHSLSVRTTALQDIRNILHHHRAWLGGLLPPNTTADGAAATGQQTELLSSLLGALLKCCDPEVSVTLSHHSTCSCPTPLQTVLLPQASKPSCFPACLAHCSSAVTLRFMSCSLILLPSVAHHHCRWCRCHWSANHAAFQLAWRTAQVL